MKYLVMVEPSDYGLATYLMTAKEIGGMLNSIKSPGVAVHIYRLLKGRDPELLRMIHCRDSYWLETMYGTFVESVV